MGYNAIEIDGEVKLDLSQDTVTEETLPEGVTAHDANGDPIEGKMKFVKSVNGKDGDVTLGAEDVGARPDTWTPSAEDVGARSNTWMPTAEQVGARPDNWLPSYSDVNADKAGTADSKVSAHNVSEGSHNDIRLLIQGLADRINAIANSTDVDLDDFKEVVAYIKANRGLIDAITTNKINYTDIINNLTTNISNKPLSAAQGVALKALIDAITVPTKVSELSNDKGYLTSYTESDPTVPSWAKASTKPSYTKSEVGLGDVDNVKQYSASNPPPYPVKSVNGKTDAVTLAAADVGAVSLVTNFTLIAVDKDGVTHTYTVYGKKDENAPT